MEPQPAKPYEKLQRVVAGLRLPNSVFQQASDVARTVGLKRSEVLRRAIEIGLPRVLQQFERKPEATS